MPPSRISRAADAAQAATDETPEVESSAQPKQALLRLDRAVVVVAFLLLGTLALTSPLLAGINGMRITGCHNNCSTALVGAGDAVIMGGPIGATMLAFLGLILLPRPNRYLWWLPCTALAAAIAALLLGDHLITIGAGG